MRNKRIKVLKVYKQILLECKRIQISNQLSNEVENKFPSIGKPKQKILSLYK